MKHIKVCKPQNSKEQAILVVPKKNTPSSVVPLKVNIDGWACVPKGNFAH